MTEPREAAAALPLTLTCAPDDRLVGAIRALVGRVGELTGDPGQAERFAAAVDVVMAWVLTHPDRVAGDVALEFGCEGDRLLGAVRWAMPEGAPTMPDHAPESSADVQVACDADGAEVRCRVSCRCA